jgi:hypothetical protein
MNPTRNRSEIVGKSVGSGSVSSAIAIQIESVLNRSGVDSAQKVRAFSSAFSLLLSVHTHVFVAVAHSFWRHFS